ncbi:hypothetical protein [Lyngbya confervoides]|uniref:Uncharacterized protein n=1 Tax=Lyngbya confervoides BDU141951 TaxID=1574623 RepID=A0ABD4SZU3_9CYAN|nr:hypothetical protein [Lyngbya confervoides]MCM1981875.1 hypothetical protein [Lyngbya confervoides BDU141951]
MLTYDPRCKRIGSYLIDAGLLDPNQVDVILADQAQTHLRFGDIAVARGWVSPATIEFLCSYIIEPERLLGSPIKPPDFFSTSLQ